MIYDNEECLRQAERIVREFNRTGDQALLVKEISGELNRFHCLGRHSVITPIERLIKMAKKAKP